MQKTIILFIILLFGLTNLSAQGESNIKLKIETGLLWTSESDDSGLFNRSRGLFLNIEPKLKISKHTVIGLRIGASVNEQKIEVYDSFEFYLDNPPPNGIIQFINPDNSIVSLVPTFDYSFIENKFRPYLGVGIGYYFLANYTDISLSPSENLLEVSVNNQIGFLFRGGFELRKIIVGIEFNFIPKPEVEIPTGQIIGTVENSYIGLAIGYSIGISKSPK